MDTSQVSPDMDIWALPLEGDQKPFPVVQTPFEERDAQFSPDGNWIAYHSNESGQHEVYVDFARRAIGGERLDRRGQNRAHTGDGVAHGRDLRGQQNLIDHGVRAGLRV